MCVHVGGWTTSAQLYMYVDTNAKIEDIDLKDIATVCTYVGALLMWCSRYSVCLCSTAPNSHSLSISMVGMNT